MTWCHSVGGGRSSRRSTAARGHSRRRQSWSPGSWSWADSSSLQSENISLYHLLSKTTTMNCSCHTWKLYVYILLTGLFQLPPDLTTILLQQAHVSSHWSKNISLYQSLDLFRSQITCMCLLPKILLRIFIIWAKNVFVTAFYSTNLKLLFQYVDIQL